MKEQYLPTKDLKTGYKVFEKVSSSIIGSVKPEIERRAIKSASNFLKRINKNKF